MPPSTAIALVVAVTVFVLILALWGIGLVLYVGRSRRRQEVIDSRLELHRTTGEQEKTLRLWHEGKEITTSVLQKPSASMTDRFAALVQEAGWTTPARSILLAVAGGAAGLAALALLISGNLLFALAAPFAALGGFWILLNRRISSKKAIFENQLVDALELAARSLRVGHPLVGAFRLISEEVAAPIGPLFASIVQQQELGVPLDRAVQLTADASHSEDLNLFATSIVIQLRSGGNLADMMERVSAVMRERMRLARRVRVLIAQTQMSKQVLMALPVFTFFLLNFINPAYMRPLYNTRSGIMISCLSGSLLLVGWYVMNKMATIRY